jgi:hypothetical protein
MVKITEKQKIVVATSLFIPLLSLLGSFLLSASALASVATKPKNVLILFHAAPGQPLYDITLSEIRTTIKRGYGGPLNLYVEYLDAERFSEKHHLQAQIDFIKKNTQERRWIFLFRLV